jgi:VCBS repeat-containing protein
MSARRLSLAAIAVPLIALSGACGGDDGDGPSRLPRATGSSTAMPSTSSPLGSTSASPDVELQDASDVAIRRWWEAVDAASHSANPNGLDAYYTATCAACSDYYKTIASSAEQGQRLAGGEHVVKTVSVSAYDGNSLLVDVSVDIQAGDLLDQDGVVIRSFTPGPNTEYLFNLVRTTQGQWLIQDIITRSAQ